MKSRLFYQVALNRLPGIGHAAVKQLTSYLGSAEKVFAANKSQLQKVPGIGEISTREILNKSSFQEAESILKDCEKNSIEILHYTDHTFPTQLKSLYDSPTILYFKGQLKNIEGRNLAIVGTRKATPYGKGVTQKIVDDLRVMNCAVISGLAYGIDIEAHRQAVKTDIPTYGILASGLDNVYPKQHWKTSEEMMEKGGLFSENPPGTKPDARLFPARNRIIAGLSDATLVVEAAAKGGALITANIANSYDKPVFAVPGNLGSTYSEGTNKILAQQKAMIYTGVKDLVYQLNWEESATQKKPDISSFDLTAEERAILTVIEEQMDGVAIDEISWKTQIQINQLASQLLTLEFNGLVKMLPGKKYLTTFNR